MEYTEKKLSELLNVSQQALSKALKDVIYTLKSVDGSTKKVKHYKYEDLPQRYKEKIETLPTAVHKHIAFGSEPKEVKQFTSLNGSHISTANFTKTYLLASPSKQKEAVLKCRLIEFYLKRDNSMSAFMWLEKTLENDIEFDLLGTVSQKQLFDWLKKYREAKAKGQNVVEAMIKKSGGVQDSFKSMTKEMKDIAIAYFLRSSKINMMNIYKNIAFMFGEHMCSYDTLNKFYKYWAKQNPVEALFAKNPDAAKNKYLIAIGSLSEKAEYVNHYWELDSTPADIMCGDGKRYTVLSAIDIYSRRTVSIVELTSTTYGIARLLRKAILTLGLPENVVIDNGKDYTSNHFESICINLGIKIHIVPPFSGDKKPHIERFFGTLSGAMFADFDEYIGANVAERMGINNKISYAKKQQTIERWKKERQSKSDEEKEAFSKLFLIKKENIGIKIDLSLTSNELSNWIDLWTNNIYEVSEHSSLETTPLLQYNNSLKSPKMVEDKRMLDILLNKFEKRVVLKKSIHVAGGQYFHPDITRHMGKTLSVCLGDDMGSILVWDEKMNFICEAVDLKLVGNKRELASLAQKEQRKAFRAMDKAVKIAQDMKLPNVKTRILNGAYKKIESAAESIIDVEVCEHIEEPRQIKLYRPSLSEVLENY